MEYESAVTIQAESAAGVAFTIRRMSFGQRLELTRRVRELARKIEFLEAGKDPREKLEAALLAGEIDRLYLEWGLVKVKGLEIDGRPATPELLVEAGPEPLCREALAAIKTEAGLSADERKN